MSRDFPLFYSELIYKPLSITKRGVYILKKNILPITNPTITTFPGYANILAILENNPNTRSWVYSYYIQTCIIEDNVVHATLFVDFDNRVLSNIWSSHSIFRPLQCPFLNVFDMSTEMLMKMEYPPVKFIKESIDSHMYVMCFIDISKIVVYNRSDFSLHEFFVFGYDDIREVLHFADFVNNKYNYYTCSYSEFSNAYSSAMETNNFRTQKLCLLKPLEITYALDFSYIQKKIYEYLYPDNNAEIDFMQRIESVIPRRKGGIAIYSGINIYTYFIKFLYDQMVLNRNHIDIRLYHGLLDHKEMMLKRFEYLLHESVLPSHKSYLCDEYKTIRDNTLIIRNQLMKFNISGKISIIDKVSKTLAETCSKESYLLEEIFLK